VLRIAWSVDDGPSGTTTLTPGEKLVVARRMDLPPQQTVHVEEIGGSAYLLVRLPYVSDPAIVITATEREPVLYRGQRANGAVVEVAPADGASFTPEPGQRISLTAAGTVVTLRVPMLDLELRAEFDAAPPAPDGSGTAPLAVATLASDDAWLVAALAVALSPNDEIVAHRDLKAAFAAWRGVEEPSVGSFDRNVLRPALRARGVELAAGARLNKIVYLVERCRRTGEFPPHVLQEIRDRLSALGHD